MFLLSHHAVAQAWEKYHLVSDCKIFDSNGVILKKFPGYLCQFFEDGSLASVSPSGLTYMNKNSEVIWKIPGEFHHKLNLSSDGKKILALAQEVITHNKKQYRVDKFLVISLEGKILHQVLSHEILRQLKVPENPRIIKGEIVASEELTHFNSFYEIPTLTEKNTPAYLQAGSYVVNSRDDGLFIISSDLQKGLFYTKLAQAHSHQVHDVQILENGHALAFVNMTYDSSPNNRMSAIHEIDLGTGKSIYEFMASPKAIFYSAVGGCVQKLDEEHLLFAHVYHGTLIYSKLKKDFVKVVIQTHMENGRYIPTLQIRALNLTRFLSHWK